MQGNALSYNRLKNVTIFDKLPNNPDIPPMLSKSRPKNETIKIGSKRPEKETGGKICRLPERARIISMKKRA